MKSEWNTYVLNDIIEIIGGGTPKRAISEYWEGKIPWLSVVDFNTGNKYVSETKEYITELGLQKSSTKMLEKGQIIISARGTVGALAQLTQPMAFNQSCYGLNAKAEYTINEFLYYLVKHQIANLQQITHGAVFDTITKDTFKQIDVSLPPLATQKKIAHILSTLDDKIELNRKMNQTLEEMAQALFKSWFVDFDPVHAKMGCANDEELEVAARELGISKEVLELFPSEFEESELGMIPEGWDNDFLDSFVEILDSKRIPLASNERATRKGSIPYYGATSIMDYVDDYIFDETLLLMGEDGSVTRENGTPFLQYIWGQSWVNNHAHVMRSKSTLSVEALYIALLNKNVTMFVTGAVQPKINQGNLKQIPIINAGDVVNKMYSTLIEPIFAKVRLITEENITLQKTRDALLPKLLSGELDVSELEL
ncbi:restriction endonuclease subunit S [Candidatus Sulfurimonas baltica]|uniref:Restriction endonuclease subunit S n=1 Tax=Candidatus Sulfurimonas baltica TaxID=2740404 RepID=A0A7S7LW63_9BACT|nr:restriction endonuclease subunit S [Candidatus Sulfurimonas baltica]QOY51709.1 restriction endonuclease subunit S [Candidatus Sulfurimonas baltica]